MACATDAQCYTGHCAELALLSATLRHGHTRFPTSLAVVYEPPVLHTWGRAPGKETTQALSATERLRSAHNPSSDG